MQDNIPDALISAFERYYDFPWDEPTLLNERLAWRAAWAEATKPCLLQIQEPSSAEQAAWHVGLDEGRAQAAQAAVAVPDERWSPDVCPITGRKFFMWVTHHDTGADVPTYGGPFDSYTIPVRNEDDSYSCERYDHDFGGWREWLDVGLTVVDDQSFVVEPDNPRYDEIRDFAEGLAALAATPAAAAQVVLPEPDFHVRPASAIQPHRALMIWDNDATSEPAYFARTVRALLDGVSAPAAQAVLDYPWRDRLLNGQNLAREEMGFAWHPELPQLDEGMKPRAFFAALGIELKHTMAEDDVEWEALDAMSDSANWSAWTPQSPSGEAWKLVAIFDTEDGPAAWWMRELHATHEEMPQAQADARYAQLLAFVLSEIRRDGMDELSAALHDEDGFPLDHEKGVAAIDRAAIAAQAAQQGGAA